MWYISAFGEKGVYLEDEVNLDITGYNWPERRKNVIEFLSVLEQNDAQGFLKDGNISYIYWLKGQRAKLGEEQLVRRAKIFGNGAHVFVPKSWIKQEVILIKRPKKSVIERILEIISPYLENIIGVYLYGSYARGEEREDSDIDLFVITNKDIKIKSKGFEIQCINEKVIEDIIKIEPLIFYSMLAEAKTIINPKLLEELRKKYKPRLLDFKEFLESCKRVIEINKKFLDMDKKIGEYTSGEAVPYSLILRLRGTFIIHSLLKEKKYSHIDFKKWIKKNLAEIDFERVYRAYLISKAEKKEKIKVKASDLIKLNEFLEKEVYALKNEARKKA